MAELRHQNVASLLPPCHKSRELRACIQLGCPVRASPKSLVSTICLYIRTKVLDCGLYNLKQLYLSTRLDRCRQHDPLLPTVTLDPFGNGNDCTLGTVVGAEIKAGQYYCTQVPIGKVNVTFVAQSAELMELLKKALDPCARRRGTFFRRAMRAACLLRSPAIAPTSIST
jgi:hypothetical protein